MRWLAATGVYTCLLAGPAQAQQANCSVQNGVYACTTSGNSNSNGFYAFQYGAPNQLPMTFSSAGNVSLGVTYGAGIGLNVESIAGNSEGGTAAGLQVLNNGSIDLTANLSQPNFGIFGIAAVQADGTGDPGGSSRAGTDITNTNTVTLALPSVQIVGAQAAGILAEDFGGSGTGEGGAGGTSSGAAVANSGAVSVAATGQLGFAGIQALSQGGNGSTNNGGGGGNAADGGVAAVTSSAPVTVGWSWNGAGAGDAGLYGVAAQSVGGIGGSAQSSGSAGGGGGGGSASVTLTLGGNVSLTGSGTPPTGAPPSPDAGVTAAVIGNIGGYAGYGDSIDGGVGGAVGGNAQISITDASVTTMGNQLPGILAIGQGGAAGNGNLDGFQAGGVGGAVDGQALVSVTAATVPVTISTAGTSAPAVAAILHGGAGGVGGTQSRTHANGGMGGNGGSVVAGYNGNADSGTIEVNLSGTSQSLALTTNGSTSPGVYAQNLGGDGGAAGNAQSPGVATAYAGGMGGTGGNVAVSLSATSIGTQAATSPGIVAISQGGVGGLGGFGGGGVGKADGGNGGNGGGTGTVTVATDAASSIATQGSDSIGILAQTISGAGGNALGNNGVSGSPGTGGVGGSAQNVTVTNDGTITTAGDSSRGILAQSLVGSGGAGGGTWGLSATGGTGGGTGTVGAASVTNGGSISTAGTDAAGILAQSIGGSGGAGGSASGFSATGGIGGTSTTNPFVSNGSEVSFTENGGSVLTSGLSSAGVEEQSIGGGGGDGGAAAGLNLAVGGMGGGGGGAANVGATLNGGSIVTQNDQSPALLAQSIGGGGGDGGNASATSFYKTIAVGGSAAGGGSGSSVTINAYGADISTAGTQSPGLEAQSIGGGGGNGGDALATSIGIGASSAYSFGGTGGPAANGGTAAVTVSGGSIATGQDPLLVYGTLQPNSMTTSGCTALPCNTLPVDDDGVLVESIGGGGGKGGSAIADAITVAIPVQPGIQLGYAAGFAVGGTGSNGGAGELAQFSLSDGASIETAGEGSDGAVVQSIGGGGGDGGDSSAAASVVGFSSLPGGAGGDGPQFAAAFDFTVGGNGGSGSGSGEVDVALSGTAAANSVFNPDAAGQTTSIATYGDYADGVLAQSIAGGGGNAGYGSGNTENEGTGTSLDIQLDMGSIGGSGGQAGNVNVNDYAGDTITTFGSGATGIVAQSIGGGGGTSQGGSLFVQGDIGTDNPIFGENGIFTLPKNFPKINFKPTVNLSLGVAGAGGGLGGDVAVTIGGSITTHGGGANGVLAQSIGGGGGLAGNQGADGSADNPVREAAGTAETISNVYDLLKNQKSPITTTAAVSIGAKGGTGSNAGTVDVQDAGTITTLGDWADGILAQSIGGGGGDGGTADATGTGAVQEVTVNADYALGGSGGAGGNGATTTLALSQYTQNGTMLSPSISTAGYDAPGIEAQSIGGGGGKGGDGSDSQTGDLTIGGATGGSGGASGDGAAVNVTVNLPNDTNSPTISTSGAFSDGADLESIGGGGGSAGMGSSLFLANEVESGTINLNVGGGSGASGNGGAVTFGPQASNEYLSIDTTGYDAFGILAQSIGGGGGIASANPSAKAMNAIAYGDGTGTGGPVSVTLPYDSALNTTGIGAIGIVAQSIGGGGGIARYGDSADNAIKLSTTPSGSVLVPSPAKNSSGGSVTVDINAPVTVSGQGSIGVFAQSIGGGGGLIAAGNDWYAGSLAAPSSPSSKDYCGTSSSCSVGGAVDLVLYGSVVATGAGSTGIFAQSQGDGPSSSQVDINVYDYLTVSGGSTGIWIDTPANSPTAYVNLIDADLTTGLGVKGTAAIVTGGGQLALANDCFNYNGVNYCGTITGNLLLNGGQFSNHGGYNPGPETDADVVNSGTVDLSMLGKSGKFTSTVTGDYTQTGTGQLRVLVDSLHNSATQLVVDGTATVAGRIVPNALTLLPGTLPVLTAGTLTASAESPDALTFKWNLARSGKTLTISPVADFTPGGVNLTASETSLAGYLTRAFDNSDSLFAEEFAALSKITTSDQYQSTLDAYSGKAAEAQSLAYINGAASVLGAAMSCPNYIDQGVRLGEDDCVWMKVTAQQSNQWEGKDTQGYRVGSVTTRLGGQKEFLPGWYLGGALAIGTTSSSEDGTEYGDSDGHGATYDGSIALKHRIGPWVFAGSVALADGAYQSTRFINLSNTNVALHGDPSLFMAGSQFRAGYELTFRNFYVQPYGDLALLYSNLRGFSESGPTPAALVFHGDGKVTVAMSPMVEVGGRIDLNGKTVLRPFGTLGASFIPDNTRSMEAGFVGAKSANGLFRSDLDSPGATADLGVGVELYRIGGIELKAEYDAMVGGSYMSQSASAKLAYAF